MSTDLTRIVCPSCGKRLKTRKSMPTGANIDCPNCKHQFQYKSPVSKQPKPQPVSQPKPQPQKPAALPQEESPVAKSGNNTPLIVVGSIAVVAVFFLGLFSSSFFGGGKESKEPEKQVAENQQANEKDKSQSQPEKKKEEPRKKEPVEEKKTTVPPEVNPELAALQKLLGGNGAPANSNLETYKDGDLDNKGTPATSPSNSGTPTDSKKADGKSEEKKDPLGGFLEDDKKGDDPNRPKKREDLPGKQDNGGNAPKGGLQGGFGVAGVGKQGAGVPPPPTTIIREVPIFIPYFINNSGGSGSGKKGGKTASKKSPKPAVNVVMRPVITTSPILQIDHNSSPGTTAGLSVSLDQAPKSAVTVKLTPPTGLVLDKTTVTFAASFTGTPQVVTVSGNGRIPMTASTRIVNLKVTASGGGLKSGPPAQIPVQVSRRSRWLASSGLRFTRQDFGSSTGSRTAWNSNIAIVFNGSTGNYYTGKYVELIAPSGLRLRLYNNRLDVETAVGSGTFFRNVVAGSWQ